MTRPRMISLSLLLLLAAAPPVTAQTVPPPSATAPAATIDAAMRKKVIDGAIAKISEFYVFPNKVPAIAKVLRAGLAGKYAAITDAKAFADAVNVDIESVANDRHMRLFWSAEPLPPPLDPDKIDPALLKKQIDFLAQRNFAFPKAEVLEGNIGYLKINGFVRPQDGGPTLAAAMAFLGHTDALIFDLRDNGGGDPAMVAMTVSYLVKPETLINTFHRRDNPVDDQIWSIPYVPGGRWSTDKPVYVLTSAKTASGGEEFAYDMQQLKRGTVIGGVTWGGANPGGVQPLDQHFAIFVPNGAAVNPISKTNWEGVGVKPDVPVDPVDALKTARHIALQKLAEQSIGDRRAELEKLLADQAAN